MKAKASKPQKGKGHEFRELSEAEQAGKPLAAQATQWLNLAEREKLYLRSVPEFTRMILTDHRGARVAERVNVAKVISEASGVSVSTVRRDIRTLRQRALKGKAPAEVELYPYLLHVQKMNALAKNFSAPKGSASLAEVEVEMQIVTELGATLKALIAKLGYDESDPEPVTALEALHEALADAVQVCRAEMRRRTEENIPF